MLIYVAAIEGHKELVCTICNHSFKVTSMTDKILDKLIERRHQGTAHGIYDIEGK